MPLLALQPPHRLGVTPARASAQSRRGGVPVLRAALVDPPSSATTPPPPHTPRAPSRPDPPALRQALLLAAAGLDRGRDASPAERAAVERAAVALEAAAPASPLTCAPGAWRLAYASCEPFRSSPFFWGFASLAGAAAAPIFAFTDAVPGAEVGVARQKLTLGLPGDGGGSDDESEEGGGAGWLSSSVRLTVGVGLGGDVVTTARLARVLDAGGRPSGTDLDVLPVETRVENSALPGVGAVGVPVGRLFGLASRGRGGQAPIRLRISYCDEVVRVARVVGEGLLFVYVRE